MKATTALLALSALTSVMLSCADNAPTGTDSPGGSPLGPGITVSAIGGTDSQRVLRGSALPKALQLIVESAGTPVEGRNVSWTPSSGSVQLTSNVTNASGVASAIWILGATPGEMTMTATVEGAEKAPLVFQATALPLMTLVPDVGTDGQSGLVGTALAEPLRVTVLAEGQPAPGVNVLWRSSDFHSPGGWVTTDTSGIALWYLSIGPTAGRQTVTASVDGAVGSPASFQITALSYPAEAITKLAGDNWSYPANWPRGTGLTVLVTDHFGNPVPGVTVVWTVESGPFDDPSEVYLPTPTDANGQASWPVWPNRTPGAGVVRAALPGGGVFVDFALTITDSIPLVNFFAAGGDGYMSLVNGTRPAVDTIPAGTVMTWMVYPFDYEDHAISVVGPESFTINGASATATFTTPGTYEYIDPFWPGPHGTLVVE